MTKLKHFSQANFPPAFLWVFDSSKSHSKHFIISTCDTQNFDVVSRASSFVSLFHRIFLTQNSQEKNVSMKNSFLSRRRHPRAGKYLRRDVLFFEREGKPN